MVSFVAGEERTIIVSALNERMNGVPVGFHRSYSHRSALVFQFFWFTDWNGSPRHRFLINANCIINCESNILDAISMLCMVRRELRMIRIEWRCECIDDVVVADDVSAEFP